MKTNKEKQSGVSMIEVLVSMLILGIAVMGYAGLEVTGLKTTNDAFVREQATALAVELKERIRMNRGAQDVYFSSDSWGNELKATCDDDPDPDCNATEDIRARSDVSEIKALVQEYMLSGDVTIRPCTAANADSPQRCITVSWANLDANDCDLTGDFTADAFDDSVTNCIELAVYDFRNF